MLKKFTSFVFILLTIACSKEELVVSGNTPPPDNTIENSTVKAYINKLYISVLGQQGSATALENAENILLENPRDSNLRKQVVENLFNQRAYYDNEFDLMLAEFLNNIDSTEIDNEISTLEFVLSTSDDPIFIDFFEKNIQRLEVLKGIKEKWINETIEIHEVHRAVVNNSIYDQINMGTENFVVSCFQNFLFRYPSESELDNGKAMVDGSPSILFLNSGSNKNDFLDIFFNSNAYHEGLVVQLYQRFLYRSPSALEVSNLIRSYNQNNNYQALQTKILISDEFFGAY